MDGRPAASQPPLPADPAAGRLPPGSAGNRDPTLSCDLETLPLWSRSSAVKACQMALSSSSFRPPMAAAALPRRTRPALPAPRRLCHQQEPHRRRCPPCRHLTAAGPAPLTPPPVGPASPFRQPSSRTAASVQCGFVNTAPSPSGGFPHQLRPFSELAYACKEMSPIPGNTRVSSDQSLRPLWESHSYYRSFGSVLRWSPERSDQTAEKLPRASLECLIPNQGE